ncbi:hypothetical protein [Sphingomonas bacterium]|uniref:hypothetical protein n=1 Tax=Sphingomonas bacterium TaxID=1895847 RepID=UPI001575CD2A|nr:hypothetical protein [Sphingomonas bacterium]
MYSKAYGDWMRAGMEAWSLGIEASAVVALRMGKLASGGDPDGAETRLMIAEKMQAALEIQAGMMTGQFGFTPLTGSRKAIRHYGRKVAANHKRLSR